MTGEQDLPRMVEVVGLPGAGKSTLCEGLRSRLAVQGRTVWSAPEWRRHWLRRGRPALRPCRRFVLKLSACVADAPLLVVAGGALLASRQGWRSRWRALRLLVVRLETLRCAAAGLPAGDVLLIDEGPLQVALRCFVDAGRRQPRDPRRYARALPAVDLVLHLKVPPDVALARAQGRARGLPVRFQGLDREELEATLEAASRCIETILRELIAASPRIQLQVLGEDEEPIDSWLGRCSAAQAAGEVGR